MDTFDYEEDQSKFRNMLEGDKTGSASNCQATNNLIYCREDVHKLRDKRGADVVSYLANTKYPDVTGQNGLSGDVYDNSAEHVCDRVFLTDANAYTVVSRSSRFHFVFMHELGHLFGACHSRSYTITNTGGLSYSGPCFRTIMAPRINDPYGQCTVTASDGSQYTIPSFVIPRIPLFASLDLEYSGHVLGSGGGSLDWNAGMIDIDAPVLAAFCKHRHKHVPLALEMVAAVMDVISIFIVKNKRKIRCANCVGGRRDDVIDGGDDILEFPYVEDENDIDSFVVSRQK